MSVVAAVKKAIGWGDGDNWKQELPDPEQMAHYKSELLADFDAWKDSYLMECAEKYPETKRLYQNMPVFDI